ncbi:MAG: hypothetical protein CMO74_08395 [Verrucomicrobiales bacterium]|nr:hypothetical protein [Verrucomicrobiales bacterium]|tara:strand:- start:956 stop:2122 length:1167 start_codon:yes stop_codon:yes gene_type:complete
MATVMRVIIGTAVLAGILAQEIWAQPKGRGDAQREAALKESFKGIFYLDVPPANLFPIRKTGVSTEPVRQAAKAFLASLNVADRKKTLFPMDDLEWRKWDNRHRYVRQGKGFNTMTAGQRELAFNLLKNSLSAEGLKQTRDIMKLNGTLAELTQRFEEYGEWLYWITIMGEPSVTQPWGWQLDGHHVVINYFVLGDQVVMSPVFMGSEPVKAAAGKFKGTEVCQAEQGRGLAFINSLNEKQRAKAIGSVEKGPTNNIAEAFRDNQVLDYMGLRCSELTPGQKARLLDLIGVYVGHLAGGHAKVKMADVKKHLGATYFGWMGGTGKDSVFYYRIQSPVILIEFDHQRPIALARSRTPTRQHIHTVIRTPNGNDYGKDLLRQHYLRFHRK